MSIIYSGGNMDFLQTFFPELYNTAPIAYDLVKISDSELLLEIQACGFEENHLDVELVKDTLHVSANLDEDRTYLHRGLHRKPFKYKFKLRDDVLVKSAKLKNGILSIVLEIKVPDDKKPRKILLTH